jgi:hypothetical protein
MPYYNTTDQDAETVAKATAKVEDQNAKVLAWFQLNKCSPPTVVWKELFQRKIPLTSVRRALTNLTDDGWLEKTQRKVKGEWGWDEHVWRLRDKRGTPVVRDIVMGIEEAMHRAETSTSPIVLTLAGEVKRLRKALNK